ncbi:hypothetical protein BP5796_03542 [Coleophoma crateriformis]|uniref:Uncharacterized protein n=1 Tax=Coleophoma crateriformis TaxID=565419 RepID=A0A3D8SPX1_9HELO|nr:hypothetical protein BP5796_03542 [Coleophoma crateriformis]
MQTQLVAILASLPFLASAAGSLQDLPYFKKRVDITWGPIFYLGPGTSEIISAVTTTYPGEMPQNQAGGLFIWPGITNNTGDLIQSIIGSYSSGQSECGTGTTADSEWCISSEVYGLDSTGSTDTQYVGDLRTLDATPATGLVFNYTLVDSETYLWNQTVHDATSGILMSTYSKISGPMTNWNSAVECQQCTPTISKQTYVNTTIVLKDADLTFKNTLYTTDGITYSGFDTPDNGKTWNIALITVAAMNSTASSSTTS